MRPRALLILAIPVIVGCSGDPLPDQRSEVRNTTPESASTCSPPRSTGQLPPELGEASGVATSRQYPGILWLHNDSGNPAVVFAIDSAGTILARTRVDRAENRDWEDIAIGPCPTGECLYIADTGDNSLRRNEATIYRIPEPAPGDTLSMPAERFPILFPDGPRDVEAIFILPDGSLYLLSKGRRHPVELYRYPLPLRPDRRVTLELVQRLSPKGLAIPFQVTSASASPDGRWVAVRTYTAVQLYQPRSDGTLAPAPHPPPISLDALAEPQGEGIALRDDGTIFLVSETGPARLPARVGRLECRLPEPGQVTP